MDGGLNLGKTDWTSAGICGVATACQAWRVVGVHAQVIISTSSSLLL